MPRVWFTSDTHFGHANIIRYCKRPFSSVAEMDAILIDNWNGVVRPEDTIYHLGDFGLFRTDVGAEQLLLRLNGKKHLIWGNHDDDASKRAGGWESSSAYAEIMIDGQRLVLFHYAMKVWHRSSRGAWQLYGHSHSNLRSEDNQTCDVGVDVPWANFTPVSITQIRNHLKHLPPHVNVDHHGGGEVEA